MGSTEGAHQMSQPQLRLRCSQGRRRVPVCDARSCETNNSIRRRRQFPQQSSPRGGSEVQTCRIRPQRSGARRRLYRSRLAGTEYLAANHRCQGKKDHPKRACPVAFRNTVCLKAFHSIAGKQQRLVFWFDWIDEMSLRLFGSCRFRGFLTLESEW